MEIASSGAAARTASIRRATKADSKQVFRLLQEAGHSHSHADWRLPADWIETPGFIVAEEKRSGTPLKLLACLAVAADPPPAAWVRLAAMRDVPRPDRFLCSLLDEVTPYLRSVGVSEVGWLAPRGWPDPWLEAAGFKTANWIVTYFRDNVQQTISGRRAIPTRPATPEDMLELAEIERQAFAPLWRHSVQALRLAYKQALSFDVAESNGRLVGFQYSVLGHSRDTAHLVRITVNPDAQGTGTGSALMIAAFEGYRRHGIRQVTLNTQVDNLPSQKLYKRFGFQQIGEQVPVWVLTL